jgi:hypothetical protein
MEQPAPDLGRHAESRLVRDAGCLNAAGLALVADPFAGGATVGRALKEVGGSRHLGTEIDGEAALVARGRPGEVVEG